MATTNRQWHEAHRMPRNVNLEQRLQWHLAHAAHCSCRPVPASILAEMKARGIAAPGITENTPSHPAQP